MISTKAKEALVDPLELLFAREVKKLVQPTSHHGGKAGSHAGEEFASLFRSQFTNPIPKFLLLGI